MYRPAMMLVVIIGLLSTTNALSHGINNRTAIPSFGHENLYLLQNVSIYDGDTLTADISVGLDVVIKERTIRLKDFDAPEITRIRRTVDISDKELEVGKQAKEFVTALASKHLFAISETLGLKESKDPYGRLVSVVYYYDTPTAKWKPLYEILRSKGFERSQLRK